MVIFKDIGDELGLFIVMVSWVLNGFFEVNVVMCICVVEVVMCFGYWLNWIV